jgi:hypothetical protein
MVKNHAFFNSRKGAYMKRHICFITAIAILTMLFTVTAVFATGDGNIDTGGGSTGTGSTGNKWNGGNDGIRVTMIRASDRAVITRPIDITNIDTSNIRLHFGKVCKASYNRGSVLTPHTETYICYKPIQPMPRIISSGTVSASIDTIKSYFTDEQVIRYICEITGMSFESLTTGDDYRLLLEPIVYLTYRGIPMAMTATEAALFDIQTGGDLNIKLGSVTKQNLPLSIYLEKSHTSDKARKKIITEYVKQVKQAQRSQCPNKDLWLLNSKAIGYHNYYQIATGCSKDFSSIAFIVRRAIKHRLL